MKEKKGKKKGRVEEDEGNKQKSGEVDVQKKNVKEKEEKKRKIKEEDKATEKENWEVHDGEAMEEEIASDKKKKKNKNKEETRKEVKREAILEEEGRRKGRETKRAWGENEGGALSNGEGGKGEEEPSSRTKKRKVKKEEGVVEVGRSGEPEGERKARAVGEKGVENMAAAGLNCGHKIKRKDEDKETEEEKERKKGKKEKEGEEDKVEKKEKKVKEEAEEKERKKGKKEKEGEEDKVEKKEKKVKVGAKEKERKKEKKGKKDKEEEEEKVEKKEKKLKEEAEEKERKKGKKEKEEEEEKVEKKEKKEKKGKGGAKEKEKKDKEEEEEKVQKKEKKEKEGVEEKERKKGKKDKGEEEEKKEKKVEEAEEEERKEKGREKQKVEKKEKQGQEEKERKKKKNEKEGTEVKVIKEGRGANERKLSATIEDGGVLAEGNRRDGGEEGEGKEGKEKKENEKKRKRGKEMQGDGDGGMANGEGAEDEETLGNDAGMKAEPTKGGGRKERKVTGAKKRVFKLEDLPKNVLTGAKVASWKMQANNKDTKWGAFSAEEDAILVAAMYEYIKSRGWSLEEGTHKVLNSKKNLEARGALLEIASSLPQRPPTSVRFRVKKLFDEGYYRGCWSKEEVDMLRRLHAEHGPKWSKLSKLMGRADEAIKFKWRDLGEGREIVTGKWSHEEMEKLCQLVQRQLRAKEADLSTHNLGSRLVRDDIDWVFISKEMRRRSIACITQWYYKLAPSMVMQGEWGNRDDRRLLKALLESGANDEDEVEWDHLIEERSAEVCLKRWKQIKRHLPGGYFTLEERIEMAMKRFAPEILDPEFISRPIRALPQASSGGSTSIEEEEEGEK